MLTIQHDDHTTVEWPHGDSKPDFNIDRVASVIVSVSDGYFDIQSVMTAYPAFCINQYIDQIFYGDIAKMVLTNCFVKQ